MQIYEIDTPLRASAFLAQIAHESAELRFMEELWGPTAQQKKYEPPNSVAKALGNTQKGDGFRYRGRGPIQVTGRANYKKYGDLLGVDLIGNPDLAATPQYAFSTAGVFWKLNGLNELADVQDFTTITKRINGGLNGLAERERYYEIAKNTLGDEAADDFAFSKPFAPSSESAAGDDPPVLTRGQEFIDTDPEGSTTFTDSRDETNPTAKKSSSRGLGSRLRNWFR
jgi:predicted chitinase